MKRPIALAVLFSAMSVAAQQVPIPASQAKPVAKASVKPTVSAKVVPINDAFAKAGLRALKAIQSDATLPDVTQSGGILFSKSVVDVINGADSEARTGAETQMSTVLSLLHVWHSANITAMSTQEELAKAGHTYKYSADLLVEMETQELLTKDPDIAALKNSRTFQNEATCAAGLEILFRARKSGPVPEVCTASQAR